MRIAVIDLGSNSIILCIAEKTNKHIKALYEESNITRIGRNIESTQQLHPDSIEKSLAVLKKYRDICDRYDVTRIQCFATDAIRDAKGAENFIQTVRKSTGIEVNILSGEKEAKLTFRAVLHEFEEHKGKFLAIDIGGGSVEIIKGNQNLIEISKSLKIGAVRIKEKFDIKDIINNLNREKITKHIHSMLPPTKIGNDTITVSTGGTITSLQAINLGLKKFEHEKVHKTTISYREISSLFDYLNKIPLKERKKIPCLKPERADIIHIGALILKSIMDFYKINSLYVSNRGVRWGLIYEMLL